MAIVSLAVVALGDRGHDMTDDAAAELGRLDEKIAENDAQGTPGAQWRAADAMYDKAELIERREGDEAALPVYAEVVRRLDGRAETGPRALFIGALNAVAVIHHCHDRGEQSRVAAETLVQGHFEDAPLQAAEAVANATLLLSRLRHQAGEGDQAVALLERLIDRYGQPEIPGHRRTSAVANARVAYFLGQAGRLDEGIRRYDSVIRELGWPVELEFRRVLARALAEKAYLLSEKSSLGERDAICKLLLERFDSAEDPEIAEHLRWAQVVLDEYQVPSRRQLRWRRP